MKRPLRILLLPGWLDSGPGHWQTRWEALHGDTRVVQSDWLWPKRGDWMARLEDVLLDDERPALLAAHSLGCQLVAAWAAHAAAPTAPPWPRSSRSSCTAPPRGERALPWRRSAPSRFPLHAPAP